MRLSDVYIVLMIFCGLSFITELVKFSAVFFFRKMDPVLYSKKGITWVKIINQLLYVVIILALMIILKPAFITTIIGIILCVISSALQSANIYYKIKLGGKENDSKNTDL